MNSSFTVAQTQAEFFDWKGLSESQLRGLEDVSDEKTVKTSVNALSSLLCCAHHSGILSLLQTFLRIEHDTTSQVEIETDFHFYNYA
jgi:hypothetical protein